MKEYKAAGPNWAIIKDKRGVMYFANDAGVLEFDGVNWTLIKMKAIARSLSVDSTGIIYVGGDNEFGFIQPDKSGELFYTSLSDKLDDNLKDFSGIYSVFSNDEGVFFCSMKRIYKYKDQKISVINLTKGGFVTFYVDKTLYYGDYYSGLYKIHNDSAVLCKGGNFFAETDIYSMIPFSDSKILIGTVDGKLFLYNTNTGISETFDSEYITDLEAKLQTAGLYVNGILKIKTGFVIFTLNDGVFITNDQFKIIGHYNETSGMQGPTVMSCYFDDNGFIEPLWLGLYNGITKLEINSPLTKIPEFYGLNQEVNEIINFKGKLYFASISGVYTLDFDQASGNYKFSVIGNTNQNQCWSFFIKDDKLFATSFGLFDINANRLVSEADNHTYKLFPFNQSVFAAKVEGLVEYKYEGDRFIKKNKINAIKEEINTIEADSEGNLWLLSNKKDLIRFTINGKDTVVEYYSEKNGLPKTDNIHFFNYQNKFYFSTDQSLLVYNTATQKLEEERELSPEFHNALVGINDFVPDQKGTFYISKVVNNFHEIMRLVKQNDGKLLIDSTTFKRLPQMIMRDIYPDQSGLVWITSTEGLFVYDPSNQMRGNGSYKTLIRKVINNDSVIFGGTYILDGKMSVSQPDSFIPSFQYNNNSITFHYASTYYIEEKETNYYTFLEGFDKTWSKPTKNTFKEYTNLREGSYIFKVKAKNIYGIESETAEYAFTIFPPWYRTIWAYFIYVALFILFVWMLIKYYTRSLKRDKERLEGIVKERTAEVVKQKEEIEQKSKHITDSINYASRIQQALLPPEEIIREYLPDHFILFKPRDIVSGDFYWLKRIGHYTVYAAADCTGHGVPGAMMSMLGISFLNEIVNKAHFNKPSEILEELRKKIKDSLRQTGKDNESKDGMDIAVCTIDHQDLYLEYAGAYNPVYIVRKGELHEIKATRNPIGIYLREMAFENHEFKLEKGDLIYAFSDGYVDQFGGNDNSKFKAKNFKTILMEIWDKPLQEQREILEQRLLQWQGHGEQTDDIIVIGVKV